MISKRNSSLSALVTSALVLAACGGGSDTTATDIDDTATDTEAVADNADNAADPDNRDPDTEAASDDAAPADDGGSDLVVDAPADASGVVDPVYHHVSAQAPAGSWGSLCNLDNQGAWAPGWRISVPTDWTNSATGGSSSFYDIDFNTPDGFGVKISWTSSIDSFGYTTGTSLAEVDFDGEMVSLMDSSDDTNQILSIDFIAQSVGGLIDMQGGAADVHQVSLASPLEMGLTQDDAVAILTSMQRERCAIVDALMLDNAAQFANALPLFDGGDPLGKELPTSDRLPFDPMMVIAPFSGYTDDQLAYIVGFDQATSDCFVAAVRPTLPTDVESAVSFVDPITPEDEAGVAALEAVLSGC